MPDQDQPEIVACPVCKGPVERRDDRMVCTECGRSVPIGRGVDLRRRMLIYGAGFAVVAGVGIALGLVRWEDLHTATPEDLDRYRAQGATRYKPRILENPTEDFSRIDAAKGPVYLFTHHHAAYYAIKKLQLEGVLPPRGNILLNFDSHDDVNAPYAVPNPEDRDRALAFLEDGGLPLEQKLERLRTFVKDDLSITSWVFPLIDDGSLSAYYYVFPERHPMRLAESRAAVVALERWMAGLCVVPGPKPPRFGEGFTFDVVRCDALPSAEALAGKSVIMSYDMDYFSNKDNLGLYDENFEPQIPTPDEIRAAIVRAVAAVTSRQIAPKVILLSESPGFTPTDQIPLITEALLAELERAGLAR